MNALHLARLFICLLTMTPNLGVLANDSSNLQTLRIPAPYSEKDIAHEYYVGLANQALSFVLGNNVPQLTPTVHMNQARAIVEMQKGNLDLFWTGADSQTEQELNAVRIPLDMGLMGFRRFIILSKQAERFSNIHSLDELRELVACQGTYWPDTKILKGAGLQVLNTPVHENLFELLATGRCDYFPRGFHEGPAEVEEWKSIFPDFIVSNQIIIHYPFTIFFYTRKSDTWLAEALEQGLEYMIDNGLLMDYMKNHPSTSHLFPLSQFEAATFFELTNPHLSNDASINNSRYWLTKEAFKQ